MLNDQVLAIAHLPMSDGGFIQTFDDVTDRRKLDVRRALDEEQFELYDQPEVNSKDGQVLGLIVPLGDWVLRKTCMTATTWPAEVMVAVNVSARQFVHHDGVASVRDALHDSGLKSSRLELEITETPFGQARTSPDRCVTASYCILTH
jgi:EAL domain-containing protein (putative c-di-GMP-specific phosphodiesterase class I)